MRGVTLLGLEMRTRSCDLIGLQLQCKSWRTYETICS